MRTLLVSICLLTIPFVGSAQPKEDILLPPVFWVINESAMGGNEGLYPEHFLTKVMNKLIVPNDSTNINITIYYVEKNGRITAEIESTDPEHPIYKVLREVLDALPAFSPSIATNLAPAEEFRDTLDLCIQQNRDAPPTISVTRRFIEDPELIASAPKPKKQPNEYRITMPEFQGGNLIKFRDWVSSELKYPETLTRARNIATGRVAI